MNMLIDIKNIDIINVNIINIYINININIDINIDIYIDISINNIDININNIDININIDNSFFLLSLQIVVNDSVRTLSLIAHSTFRGFGLSIFRRFEVSAFRTTLARPTVDFELASDAEATPEMK